MNDTDTKAELPNHLILGASEYTRIKVQEMPRVGQPGEIKRIDTSLLGFDVSW